MAEPAKSGNSGGSPQKGYSLAVFLFIMGIVAVGVTIVVSGMRNMPRSVMLSEGIILLCLLGLLIFSITSRKKANSQQVTNDLHPYASVDKKSIEGIFAAIADEEKKRQRLDAFATGVDFQATNGQNAETKADDAEKAEKADDAKTAENGEKKENADTEAAGGEKKPGEEGEKQSPEGSGQPAKNRPQGAGAKRPGGPQNGQKKKRPYDPYYEDRYDKYGKPVRRRPPEVLYDEYGNPVRRRPPEVLYDEYGRPVRRRDPYGRPVQKRRPDGTPIPQKKRPAGAAGAAAAGAAAGAAKALSPDDPARRRRPAGATEAPVGMAGLKEQSRYSDEYVPVAIEDDFEDTYVPTSRPAGGASYYEDEVDRDAPVIIPDDDYRPEYEDDIAQAAIARKKKTAPPTQGYDKNYRSSYTEDEVFVIIPDYDDTPDYAAEEAYGYAVPPTPRAAHPQGAPQQRRPQPGRAPAPVRQTAPVGAPDEPYVPEYEDEDVVTVLPRDEEYDSYMEKKRAEERRAERRRSGKTALTIQKMRRKKIRRKSRKYTSFRCSVHKLSDYLNSYSKKVRSKP